MARSIQKPEVDSIESRIVVVRGRRVLLAHDLADLYGVTTKQLNQQVRRNTDRFPGDFMYVLTSKEVAGLRSQIVTSNVGRGGTRYKPLAFTEQGVAMLSSVLNSERAVRVNIGIMRAFVKLRDRLDTHDRIVRKIAELEQKYDGQFVLVFKALRDLLDPPEEPETNPRRIGFAVRKNAPESRGASRRRA